MASNGPGVNLDASVPPVRITFYDTAHADAQDDGLGNFDYDYHKIWACMGRVGSNAVMRVGFVEEGNPFTGAAAGWIEPNAGGVFGGVNQWNALTAYDPLGGPALNDYCIYGALEPFGGFMLHLDAPLAGQPAFTLQYWSGAWTTIAFTTTPDFTQALGTPNQRAEWTFYGLSPAPVAAVIGTSVTPYYFARLLRGAADAFGAPAANTAYKDYLYGHFKRYWSEYDLKRGDDGAGSSPTSFHDTLFSLSYRHGFGTDGARGNQAQRVIFGKKTTQTTRASPLYPWVIQQNVKKAQRNYSLYGGAVVGVGEAGGAVTWIKSGGTAEILACLISGYQRLGLGSAGASTLDLVEDLVFINAPDSPNKISENFATLAGKNISMYVNQKGLSTSSGMVRLQSSGSIQGAKFNDDRFTPGSSVGQIFKSVPGRNFIVDHQWGGPDSKLAEGSLLSAGNELVEPRRLHILVHENGTNTPPVSGMPVRITGSDGVVQTEPTAVLDANGECDFNNDLGEPYGDVSGNRFVWASVWRTTGTTTEELLDEPLKVEINAGDMAGFNPDYVSMTILMRFPRGLVYNLDTATWERVEWQREDASIMLGLKRSAITPITSADIPLPESSEIRYEGVVP